MAHPRPRRRRRAHRFLRRRHPARHLRRCPRHERHLQAGRAQYPRHPALHRQVQRRQVHRPRSQAGLPRARARRHRPLRRVRLGRGAAAPRHSRGRTDRAAAFARRRPPPRRPIDRGPRSRAAQAGRGRAPQRHLQPRAARADGAHPEQRSRMNTVFVDVDTQLDFLYPSGALYVPGAERIVPAVARLNRYAAANGVPVISTTDAHTESDPEFQVWPHHCVAGTWGQRKAEATLLPQRVVVPNRDVPIELAPQIILEKQTVDVFAAPNLARIIDRLAPDRFVVYGVVTEICVLYAVRGLVKYGKPVTVVTDAIETLAEKAGREALAEACAAGATLSTANEICSRNAAF